MRSLSPFPRSLLIAALIGAVPLTSLAQEEKVETASQPGSTGGIEQGDLRIRYGPTFRNGSYKDTAGPGLTYGGMTPNDVSGSADFFGSFPVGGWISLGHEGFSLNDASGRVTAGSVWRGGVGPAGKLQAGPLRVEVMAGYSYAEIPEFGNSALPTFAHATRHSLLLASRIDLDLPFGAMVEASGEVPISLAASDANGAGKSSGFGAGGGVGLRFASSGRVGYGALIDYQYVTDSFTAADGTTSSQNLSRVGIALRGIWFDAPLAPPPPRLGGLLVSVVDAASGQPLPNAQVALSSGGQSYTVTTAADGRAAQRDLPPGQVVASVNAGGYLPGQAEGVVTAGQDSPIEVRLKHEPPKTGGLEVSFLDKESSAPIGNVKIKVRGNEYVSDEQGKVSLVDLPIGPVEISAVADGYRPASEVASVVGGQKSPVEVKLVKAEQRVLATISGLIRSTRGGAPIPATLEIPEASVKTKADANGAFTVKVPGGSYRVIIAAPGYLTQHKSVTVKDGDEAIFNVDLHPQAR